jgi:hypothetical protein
MNTLNFLEIGLFSFIENQFKIYENKKNMIYSTNFEEEFLIPLFVKIFSIIKKLVNKFKKKELWNSVYNLFEKCCNDLNESMINLLKKNKTEIKNKEVNPKKNDIKKIYINDEPKIVHHKPYKKHNILVEMLKKDEGTGNNNIKKYNCYFHCVLLCIKTSIINEINNELIEKVIKSINDVYCFISDKYEKFFVDYIIKIHIYTNTYYNKYNYRYLYELKKIFDKLNIYEDELKEKLEELISNKNNKFSANNIFEIMQKNINKLERSRNNSPEKSENYNPNIMSDNNIEKNQKIDKFFIKKNN